MEWSKFLHTLSAPTFRAIECSLTCISTSHIVAAWRNTVPNPNPNPDIKPDSIDVFQILILTDSLICFHYSSIPSPSIPFLSCAVLPCPVISWPVLSCPVLPCCHEQSTYVGHIFSATATATNELVDFMEVNGGPYTFSPINRLESCEVNLDSPIGMFTQVLYRLALPCTALCCTALCCTALCCTVLCCTVLYCTVLYCTVLYCTVLYRLASRKLCHVMSLHHLILNIIMQQNECHKSSFSKQ